jgi:hypothetical protein
MAWLTGWYRRKPKLVRGSTAGGQTDYQLKLTIYKGSGTDTDSTIYLGGYVNDDFSDLRFTSSDETTLLPYYIESYTSGVSAVVWIKIDSIPADPFTKTIYIYYDNLSATSLSDATTTLLNTATGGTITTNVQNRVHSFTSNGTFTLEKSTNVKALVVAGGGSGGIGGGGAGGLTYNASFAIVGGIGYSATIGAGGTGKAYVLGGQSNPGGSSSFSTISTTGGGAAGFQNVIGGNGGSGGGAGVSNVQYTGGTGVAGQGFAGADNTTINPFPTGGGGGASQAGVKGVGSNGGKGGDGTSNNITGVATFYAGGGGGCASQAPGNGGTGGLGGGGAGSNFGAAPGTNGTPNTGGGGGGGAPTPPQTASSGGSGTVIISYVFRNFASPEPTFSATSPEQIYTANLTVSSTPTGAEIWINNTDQGVTTTGWFILNPGIYTVMLTKPGYEDYIEIITLSSNQNAIVQGNLISLTGNLDISSTPSGAEIFLAPTGSPLVDQGIVTPNTISLTPLTYDYKLTHIDYYNATGSFTITSGFITILNISLTPLPCPITPKYSGNIITMNATPVQGVAPYTIQFRKSPANSMGNDETAATEVISDIRIPGGNNISGVAEGTTIIRVYTLDSADIEGATTKSGDTGPSILFASEITDSCTPSQSCIKYCKIFVGCTVPVCDFIVI